MRKLLTGAVAVVLLFWFITRPVSLSPANIPPHAANPENGEMVFHTGGCASCHGSGLEGGLKLTTDFGVFHVPNISPDTVSGIGSWTTTDFVNAMMLGVSPDGVHYYPSFPYTSYTRMRVQDVIDLKAYIDELPAVKNRVTRHKLGFPWNIRRGIGLWKLLFLDQKPVIVSADDQTVVERGRYLVEGAGHCGECHTPRNSLGGLQPEWWLAGAPNPDGDGKVPNITPHRDGLKSWSESDIDYYLETGFTPDFDTAGNSMVEIQENIARLPGSDRKAIAAYLKSIPAIPDRESR